MAWLLDDVTVDGTRLAAGTEVAVLDPVGADAFPVGVRVKAKGAVGAVGAHLVGERDPDGQIVRVDLDGDGRDETVTPLVARWTADGVPTRGVALRVEGKGWTAVGPVWTAAVTSVGSGDLGGPAGSEIVVQLAVAVPDTTATTSRLVVLGRAPDRLPVLFDETFPFWPEPNRELWAGGFTVARGTITGRGTDARAFSACAAAHAKVADAPDTRCLEGFSREWTWDGTTFAPEPLVRGIPVQVTADGKRMAVLAARGEAYAEPMRLTLLAPDGTTVERSAADVAFDDPQLAAWCGVSAGSPSP